MFIAFRFLRDYYNIDDENMMVFLLMHFEFINWFCWNMVSMNLFIAYTSYCVGIDFIVVVITIMSMRVASIIYLSLNMATLLGHYNLCLPNWERF